MKAYRHCFKRRETWFAQSVRCSTFPHLRGEINPVDFIALECLRVFVPEAYAVIRDNKQKFSGTARERGEREAERSFHKMPGQASKDFRVFGFHAPSQNTLVFEHRHNQNRLACVIWS